MSLGRQLNFICYATSGTALMMSSAHCSSHIVLICIVVSYGLTLRIPLLIELSISYNSVLYRLLCISKLHSASNMFVAKGIPSFAKLYHKSIIDFKTELSVVQTLSLQHVYQYQYQYFFLKMAILLKIFWEKS